MKNPIDARIQQLQTLVKESSNLHINSALLDYSGVVEYYAQELVMTVKAGTLSPDRQNLRARQCYQ
jgi:glycolate oxidase FAD binding subunit